MNEAVTTKKISMMKTTSSMGVRLISSSLSLRGLAAIALAIVVPSGNTNDPACAVLSGIPDYTL